jgi:tetratricopeptide (TPR) repeat protein
MTIPTKTLRDLPVTSRKLFEKAGAAIAQKNYPYAFDMLRGLLRAEPGFSEGRKALRQAQLESVGNKASLVRGALALLKTAWPLFVKGPMLVQKGKLRDALDLAEAALCADPALFPALQFMSKTAQAAGLLEAAVQAMETALFFKPKSTSVMIALAQLYGQVEEFDKGLRLWQTLLERNRNNPKIESEVKRFHALAAMKRAKWEEADSYRDVIKDKQEAETLEQQTRSAARDTDTLQDLIRAAESALAQQKSVSNHKRLAELHRQAKNWDAALAQYEALIALSGSLDPAIDDAITDVHRARFADAIEQWQAFARTHPEKAEEAETNIVALRKQKDDIVFDRMLQRVRRYPNDAGYRFELGMLYWQRNELDHALQELQLSQRSPQYRRRALACMGRCMVKKGLPDLAVEQFNAALDGMEKNDPDRKECLYDLALIYEQRGQRDQLLTCLREIYAMDVNFRDVGARLQELYKAAPPG